MGLELCQQFIQGRLRDVWIAFVRTQAIVVRVQLAQDLRTQMVVLFKCRNFQQSQEAKMVIDGIKPRNQRVNPDKQVFQPQ